MQLQNMSSAAVEQNRCILLSIWFWSGDRIDIQTLASNSYFEWQVRILIKRHVKGATCSTKVVSLLQWSLELLRRQVLSLTLQGIVIFWLLLTCAITLTTAKWGYGQKDNGGLSKCLTILWEINSVVIDHSLLRQSHDLSQTLKQLGRDPRWPDYRPDSSSRKMDQK